MTEGERLEAIMGRRPDLGERGVEPSARRGQGADWDNATAQFPSVKQGQDQWVEFFDRRPEVMLQILGDIYRETKAEELRESGRAPTGRRPKAINGNLDDLYKMITPQYSVEPFGDAVKELIGTRSLRAFAAKVPMNHHTLTRLMRGDLKLEGWRLEQIAAAAKVNPHFFREYREMQLLDAIGKYLSARPNVSIQLTKRIRADIKGGRR
jgi:hypothetical protein